MRSWDPVPEDTGCVMWHTCLSCPLPRCVYDDWPEFVAETAEQRAEAIYLRWKQQEPKDVGTLAGEFGVSRRTVYRAIAGRRNR